jgi:uncharacterized protein YkwD
VTGVNPPPCPRLLCALLVLACAPPVVAPPPVAEYAAMEREVARRVNAHRATRRLAALSYDTAVASVARAHSLEMAAHDVPMGHDGFHQRADRVDRFLPLRAIAENVAMNDYNPARTVGVAVSGWLASPHHLENIEGNYDVTGVGIVRARDGTFFYTQLFVARRRVSGGRP